MKKMWRAGVALILAGVVNLAHGQAFPNKPVRFVIGFTPGTIVDIVARLVGTEMEKRLGQPVVLEFKSGANGTIGAKFVSSAPADGYTLFYGNTTGIHPVFIRSNAVDAAKDLTPVSLVVTAPFFFYTSAKIPARTLQELSAYSKANPADGLRHGATSATVDLIVQMLANRTGISSRSIPYKASPQIVIALIAGEVNLATTSNVQSFLPHVQSGAVRTLFVAAAGRSALVPNVPTAAEVGLANFELAINFGLWAPPGTPRDVALKLSEAVSTALKTPAVAEKIRTEAAAEPVGSSPDEQLRQFDAEIKFWTEAARLANFKAP